MGEAKRRKNAMREAFLQTMDAWSFEPPAWEAAMVAEVKKLPVVTVHRVPKEHVDYMRMPPGACHKNAQWYADNDPTGTWKAVTGWMLDEENFVLHSVIFNGRDYACITPPTVDLHDHFEFAPDPQIIWHDHEDGTRHPFRNGVEITIGIRANPAKTIADCQVIRSRLLAGVDPLEATVLD